MKSCFYRLLLICLMLIGLPGHALCGSSGNSLDLEVQLFPERQLLVGEAQLRIPADHLLSEYVLRLSPRAEISRVTLDDQPAVFSFSDDQLSIDLPAENIGRVSLLTIHYQARFADPLPETTVGMENPSFGVAATIGEVGAYLSPGTAWFPQSQVAPESHRIRIEGPEGLYGVTSGQLLEHGSRDGKSYTLWETSGPTDGLALSAGYYRIFQEQTGRIQVLAFLSEKNASLAPTYLDPTKKYLQFYQRLLGPYPYEKFAIVENFLPTGYGLPSWTLLGSNVIALPFIPHTSLPHEIVHSWFGNAVDVDYRSGNWAEGLTSYLSDYLLKEQRSAEQGREYRLKLLRDYAALVSPDRDYPLTRFVSRTSKPDQAIGYGKAAMVFHMLRQDLGEEKFWSALRRVIAEGSGERIGWNDLLQFFSEESGRDLSGFFRQWVEQPGALQLSFEDVAVRKNAAGWEVRGAIVQPEPFYRFLLPLQLQTEAGTLELSVAVSGEETPFLFATDAPPLQLSGDPNAHLFRHLVADELPITINDLRASRRLLVVTPSLEDPLLEASMDLLRGLQKQQAQIITWEEFDSVTAAEFDLLFIGWPPPGVFTMAATESLQIASDSFSWQGVRYAGAADSLFLCRKKTGDGQRLVAVFHPLSAVAAQKVARKIPHYGRYSFLVFKDGANLIKKTNEAGSSPLKIQLVSEQAAGAGHGNETPQLSSQ